MQGPSWAGADASLLGHSLHGLHGDRAREYDGERLPGEGQNTLPAAGMLANRLTLACVRLTASHSFPPGMSNVQRIEDLMMRFTSGSYEKDTILVNTERNVPAS